MIIVYTAMLHMERERERECSMCMHCQLRGFPVIQFDPHLRLEGSQTSSILVAETPTQRGTIASQELDGSLLPAVVTRSGIAYLLRLAIFCVCGFLDLCGRCALKHKESAQLEYTVASHKAERHVQVHAPPRYPAPVYEDAQPAKANKSNYELHLADATSHKSEQQAYSTALKSPAPVYEDVLPVRGERGGEGGGGVGRGNTA